MGLLDYYSAARDKMAGGLLGVDASYDHPGLVALGGLLSGDFKTAKDVTRMRFNNVLANGQDAEYAKAFPNAQPFDPVAAGLSMAPMVIGSTKAITPALIKQLEKANPSTLPKVPTQNIFANEVGAVDSGIRFAADDAFAANRINQEQVDISKIVPTQKNITINNLKSIGAVTELPDLVKVDGKYYITDGHHRIARDILSGNSKVNARVYNGK